jgi:pimeloyl-ACP methyl ester carboxylesterase
VQGLILAETSYGTTTTIFERIGTLAAMGVFALMSQKQLIELSKNTYGILHASVKRFVQEEMSLYSIEQSKRVMTAVFNYSSKDKLERLHMRTLILVAAENRQTYAQGKTLSEQIGNATLVRVPDAHHLLNMDNPLYFNSALLQFLQNYHAAFD